MGTKIPKRLSNCALSIFCDYRRISGKAKKTETSRLCGMRNEKGDIVLFGETGSRTLLLCVITIIVAVTFFCTAESIKDIKVRFGDAPIR